MTEKDPFELWKKTFLIGLGATAATVEKFQEIANELVERGEMTQKEAKNFSEEIRNRAMKEKEQFDARIKETVDSYVKTAVKGLGLATREDLETLRAELKAAKAKAKS